VDGVRKPVAELVVKTISALRREQITRVQLIYETAFVPDLRVPFSELTEPGGDDRAFVALDGPEPVGFSALRLLGSAQWSFLRYFAVARQRRRQGIGRRFWRLLNRSLAEEAWPTRIVFEVEDPDEAADDAPERVIRQRRVDFWTACGARLLPASGYVLPDYTGCGTTEPMLLMAATSATTPPIEGDQLRSLILAIYADRYGLSATDPLVIDAIAQV
jgi:GNAT superfamily N-acetyltransferase